MVHYFLGAEKHTFLVGGYSDGESSPAEQEPLSLVRAKAVRAYLI